MLVVVLLDVGGLGGQGSGSAGRAMAEEANPGAVSTGAANAEEIPALAHRIDAILADGALPVPRAEAEPGPLVHRLYLDLIGVPPSIDEFERYLADDASAKYAQLVDALLVRPEFVEHWAERFDVMLMERRANTNIPQDQWAAWLRQRIAERTPLNHWMADLISADGAPGPDRAAARFLLDRELDPHAVTRDIGRIYFGMDLQCAQCHDHPSIDSYLQADYHGLLGFVVSLSAVEVQDGDAKIKMVAEKPAAEAPFESVFDRGVQRRVWPHIPGCEELDQPWSIPGEELQPAAAAGHPEVPKHSRRAQLAKLIRDGEQEAFNRNLANRLWALVFGRGIVDPVDLMHAEEPRHPELLDVLAGELPRVGFDLRAMLRQLVLSEAYRRGPPPLRYQTPATDVAGQGEGKFLVPGNSPPSWLPEVLAAATARRDLLMAQVADAEGRHAQAEADFETALAASDPIENERLAALAAVDASRSAFVQSSDAAAKAEAARVASDQTLAAATSRGNALQAALDATTAALAAVGEDVELAAAVELLRQRSAAAREAIPPAQQAADANRAAFEAAKQKSDADRAALVAAQAAADQVNQRRLADHRLVVQHRQALLASSQSLAYLRAELRDVQQWIDYSELAGAGQPQQVEAVRKLETMMGERFDAMRLVPLSPEQIGWSTLTVTGQMNHYIAKHLAELEKESPATEQQRSDPAWTAERQAQAVRRARAELAGNIQAFVSLYGSGPGQPQDDFFATADQALFTSNGGSLFAWAAPGAGNVTDRMAKAASDLQAASNLYRGILGRDPTTAEIEMVRHYFATAPDQRPRLAQEMVWSLLAGAEFRFNH